MESDGLQQGAYKPPKSLGYASDGGVMIHVMDCVTVALFVCHHESSKASLCNHDYLGSSLCNHATLLSDAGYTELLAMIRSCMMTRGGLRQGHLTPHIVDLGHIHRIYAPASTGECLIMLCNRATGGIRGPSLAPSASAKALGHATDDLSPFSGHIGVATRTATVTQSQRAYPMRILPFSHV